MKNHTQNTPDAWNLKVGHFGELMIGNVRAVQLAQKHGTPLHVLEEEGLEHEATGFYNVAQQEYPGKVTVHYPFKCNSTPAVIEIMQHAGFRAEVMTGFELALAQILGFTGNEIIVNGPCKTPEFLQECVDASVRFVIVDSIDEMEDLNGIAEASARRVAILLRVNPDFVPRGMNHGSATGSRVGCAFGLDLKGGEVEEALGRLTGLRGIEFHGFHLHLGTGIRFSQDYADALQCLSRLARVVRQCGRFIRVLDVGGGFASMTSSEFTAQEMFRYQIFGMNPSTPDKSASTHPREFMRKISQAVFEHLGPHCLPELIYEPGRCIVSPHQLLLLGIHRMKERKGVGKWIITDGGLGTLTLPTYYESHDVLLCNDVHRPTTEKVNIIGPACFAGDIVYRNKLMPRVEKGEILAVMDTGAYFLALESSFGFPRAAIVAVRNGMCRVIRARETYAEMAKVDFQREDIQTKNRRES